MRILIWVAQVVLSVSFVWASGMKLLQPAQKLVEMWPWTAECPILVLVTGIADLLVGLGVLLPSLFRIRMQLVVYAAYAAIVQMFAATAFHIVRGEVELIGINVFFGLLAVFIVLGNRRNLPDLSKC